MSGGHSGSKPIGAEVGGFLQKIFFLGFNPLDLEGFLEYIGEKGVSRALILWMMYVGLFAVLSNLVPHLGLFTIEWIAGTAPLWLPILLYFAALRCWIWYVQSFYLAGQEAILLEVKMPREVTRSPRAMELALVVFSISSGETTWINRAWQGGTRPFWSFEIASFGGEVHFYVWTWKGWRNTVETTLYAYYPELEIEEVEDYALKFNFDPKVHETYCNDWWLETYNPHIAGVHRAGPGGGSNFAINAYPFKTYMDFELDKDPEEEFKVDPLTHVTEILGSIRPGDQIWIQIVIRMAGKQGVFKLWGDLRKRWQETVEEEVSNVRLQSLVKVSDEQKERFAPPPNPRVASSWRFAELIERMERNLGKTPFEVGMRGWLVTTEPLTSNYYNAMRWIWRVIGDPQEATHLRPRRWHPPFDYPWQDFRNIRWNMTARRFLDAYRRRLFFFSPWVTPTNIMTNEMIATLWHPLPSSSTSPGIERVHAKKVSAPHNLPTT
jgi:hypothetical protein